MSTTTTFDCSARLATLDEQHTFVSKSFSRSFSSLYKFLGECHALVVDIGSDGSRVESLNESLKNAKELTDRQRKLATSVTAKVVLYVFRKPDGDLSNRSTISNYKRAIQKALDKRLSSSEFLAQLENGGIIAFISEMTITDKVPVSEALEEKRLALVANTVPSVSTIGLIENKNPVDTFAVVVYRVDGGQLVPCYVTDNTKAINSLITAIIPIDKRQIEEEADRIAEEARKAYLFSQKAS